MDRELMQEAKRVNHERQQKTIDDAIRDSKGNKRFASWMYLMKHFVPHRHHFERSLLTFVMLHTGIEKSVWTLPDSRVMKYMGCKKSKFFDALKAVASDYLLSHTGPPENRTYFLSLSNLVDTMETDHQAKFYELLGTSRQEIALLVGPSKPSTFPPHGQRVHEMDNHSTTWNSSPRDGQPFHHMDAPNKEEEQFKNRLQEQVSEPVKNRRPEDGELKSVDDGGRKAVEVAERIITAIHYPKSQLKQRLDDQEFFLKVGVLRSRERLSEADIEDAIEFVNTTPNPRSRAALFQTSLTKSLGRVGGLNQLLASVELGAPTR